MSYRILIADNHDGLRRRMRSQLQAAGFEICGEATDGYQTIERTTTLQPDLIILEIWLPFINGLEAIPEIARAAPRAKILVFCIDEAEELRVEAFRRGAHGFVCKSNPENLIDEVNRLIR